MTTDEATIYINDVAYDSNQYFLKVVERMNEVPFIEGRFFDIAEDNVDLVRGNQVYLKANGVVVSPLFEIKKSNEQSDTFRNITCYGFVESKLGDFVVEKTASSNVDSQAGRPQYDNVLAGTIVSQQLALYSTGVTQGTVDSDYASLRSENDTLVSFFSGISKVVGKEWFASYSANLATRYINITTRGTDKSGTITLNMSGANQNCINTSRLEDYESLKNEIKVFGYGDGINQLESFADHSTSIRSKLSAAINSTQTTIPLLDASSFPSSGSVWVGCEKCNYSSKVGQTLGGVTRGVAFRGNVKLAYAHLINSPVCSGVYSATSPQSTGSGSSINSHGRKQKNFILKEVIEQSTLDILAEKLMLERKGTGSTYSPPDRIVVNPSDYNWGLANIFVGDQVTITDVDSNLSGVYRCYGKIFLYDVENGDIGLTLEFSNTTFNVLSEIAREQNESVSLQKYMQGSTNIYAVNETDNVEAISGVITDNATDYQALTLFFNIPEDAVAINSVKLSYRNEAPKTWGANTSSGGGTVGTSGSGGSSNQTSSSVNIGHTHTVNIFHTHTIISPPHNHEMFDHTSSSSGGTMRKWSSLTQYGSNDVYFAAATGDDLYTSGVRNYSSYIVPGSGSAVTSSEGGGSHSHTVSIPSHTHSVTLPDHSHTVAYDLAQQSYTASDFQIATVNDASVSPVWVDRTSAIETALSRALRSGNNGSEIDLDLTSFFSSTGWKGIKIAANNNARIKAQVVIKCFVQARLV